MEEIDVLDSVPLSAANAREKDVDLIMTMKQTYYILVSENRRELMTAKWRRT